MTIKNNMDRIPEDLENCKSDQKSFAIYQWYLLDKNPEENAVYGNNLQGSLKGITKYQTPFEKIYSCRMQTYLKLKKNLWPLTRSQIRKYNKKDLSDEAVSNIVYNKEETERH